MENAVFPYKTSISEATAKTNRMMSTKWTYHKERSFATNYFFFLILFQFKNLLHSVVDLMYQLCKWPYLHFLWALEFYLTVLIPWQYP